MVVVEQDWDRDFYSNEAEIKLDQDFQNCVIVRGLPIVDGSRYQKLVKVVRKKFGEFGEFATEGIFIPFRIEESDDSKSSEDNKAEKSSSKSDKTPNTTDGIAFLQYKDPESAMKALSMKKFDKKTPLSVNLFEDFQKYQDYSLEYKEPSIDDVQKAPDPSTYLQDEYGRDQYVIRQRNLTEVYWNDPIRKDIQGRNSYVDRDSPDTPLVDRRTRMILANTDLTEGYVQWSPRGTYLVAIQNEKDIVLFSGEEMKEFRRFTHPGVIRFAISPMENYLVTLVPNEVFQGRLNDIPRCIIVWDIETGKIARGFRGDWALAGGRGIWPVMKWSYDDKYLARMGEDVISIYETPTMGLVDKKHLTIRSVKNFEWSPSGYLISYTVPEQENMPATVQILSVPSLEVIGKRSFQLVNQLSMGWHDQGRYLAVKVKYYAKRTKKDKTTSFEIFSVQRKNCPVDRVELGKDEAGQEITEVVAFAFEPNGNRFGIIHGSYPGNRADVSIYETGKQIRRVAFVKKIAASHLFWSPKGTQLVLAGLGERNGLLSFYDCHRYITIKQEEHYMCTGLEWSPCGRYVSSFVTQSLRSPVSRVTMENGYKIWTLYGELLVDNQYSSLFQFDWRPRTPDVLKTNRKRAVQRNLAKYSVHFDEEDEKTVEGTMGADARRKRNQLKAFREYAREISRQVEAELAEIKALLRGEIKDDEYEIDEVEIQQEISREEIIVED
uniref:Eukaryotic translation initiation factor 3 subunit B-like n=2 Tax=Hirondellea gigas TaxID=1518452 RepID=A0A6A7FVW0_9CRUS